MNTWLTSDTHFKHTNICKGSSRWPGGDKYVPTNPHEVIPTFRGRVFANQDEMTELLIQNINSQAKQDDTIRHGGDWSFGGIDNVVESRLRIVCNTIHLSLGNHDHLILKNREIPTHLIAKVQARFPDATHLQDLFTTITLKQDFRIGKTRTTLSHYAERIWDKSHHGSIQLHGHSHAGLETMHEGGKHPVNKFYNKYRTMDVGVDNAYRIFGEYRLFHINEVQKIMDKRIKNLTMLDHHDKNTAQ